MHSLRGTMMKTTMLYVRSSKNWRTHLMLMLRQQHPSIVQQQQQRWFGKKSKRLDQDARTFKESAQNDEDRWDQYYDKYPQPEDYDDDLPPDYYTVEQAMEKLHPQVKFKDMYYEVSIYANMDTLGYLTFDEQYNGYIEGTFELPHRSGRRPRVVVMTPHKHLNDAALDAGALLAGDRNVFGPKFLTKAREPSLWFDRIIASNDLNHFFYSNDPLAQLLEKLGKNPKPADSTLIPPDEKFLDIVKAHIEGDIVPYAIDVQNDGFFSMIIGKHGEHTVEQVRENLYSVIDQLYTLQVESEYEVLRKNQHMLIDKMAFAITQLPRHRRDQYYQSTDFLHLDVRRILRDIVEILEKQLGYKPTDEYLTIPEKLGLEEKDLEDDNTLNKVIDMYLEEYEEEGKNDGITDEDLDELAKIYVESEEEVKL